MRSSKLFFVGGLTLLAVFGLLLAGCSDDNTTTPGGTSIVHSQYDETQQQINAFVDSTLAIFNTGLNIIEIGNNTDSDTATSRILYSAVEPDSVVSSNEWYLVYNTDIDFAAGYVNVILDSIRFMKDGAFLEAPKTADAMNIRHNWNLENLDTSVAFSNYVNTGDINLYNVDRDTVTVIGTSNLEVTSKEINEYSTITRNYDIQTTFNNLKIENITGDNNFGCPYSGSITATVELVCQVEGQEEDTSNWQFVFTFENGVANVTVTMGTREGSYTCDFCSLNQ